jgi:hypothetical protein
MDMHQQCTHGLMGLSIVAAQEAEVSAYIMDVILRLLVT